jgi:predicted nucleic acid-binding protein
MYLVDTNVLSEARRGGREARDWFRSVNPNEVYLSALTLGEVAKGVALKRRNDPAAAATLQLWLDRLSVDHAKRVLPVTEDIALEWGAPRRDPAPQHHRRSHRGNRFRPPDDGRDPQRRKLRRPGSSDRRSLVGSVNREVHGSRRSIGSAWRPPPFGVTFRSGRRWPSRSRSPDRRRGARGPR